MASRLRSRQRLDEPEQRRPFCLAEHAALQTAELARGADDEQRTLTCGKAIALAHGAVPVAQDQRATLGAQRLERGIDVAPRRPEVVGADLGEGDELDAILEPQRELSEPVFERSVLIARG